MNVNFEKVVIKGDDFFEDWYLSENFDFEDSALEPMDMRPYIKISKRWKFVTIDSKLKGSLIILDDIFFASRCFMIDGFRRIEGYEFIKVKNNTLEIKVLIDNED